jgi:P27 family predicted phage terminase small subunit
MRTRPKKPTRLKRLMGNPGRRPLNDREPLPIRTGEPPIPDWLQSPLALEEWRRRIPELAQMGVVAPIDGTTCGAYCELFGRWRTAENAIAVMAANDELTGSLLIKTAGGGVAPNPLVWISANALNAMVKIGGLLGLDPSSRAGLKAPPDEDTEAILQKYNLRRGDDDRI